MGIEAVADGCCTAHLPATTNGGVTRRGQASLLAYSSTRTGRSTGAVETNGSRTAVSISSITLFEDEPEGWDQPGMPSSAQPGESSFAQAPGFPVQLLSSGEQELPVSESGWLDSSARASAATTQKTDNTSRANMTILDFFIPYCIAPVK